MSRIANKRGIVVQEMPNQISSNITEWRGSNGGVLTVIDRYGKIGVGTSSVHASAKFQIDSVTSGFLQPRMTTTERDAISNPATGLQVYNTDNARPEYFDGSIWKSMENAGGAGGASASNISVDTTGYFDNTLTDMQKVSDKVDNYIEVNIDFQVVQAYIYNVTDNMKFTTLASESTNPTLSIPLGTTMSQFTKLTITPNAIGLVKLKGIKLP